MESKNAAAIILNAYWFGLVCVDLQFLSPANGFCNFFHKTPHKLQSDSVNSNSFLSNSTLFRTQILFPWICGSVNYFLFPLIVLNIAGFNCNCKQNQIRFHSYLADQLNTVVTVESDKAWCVQIYQDSALQ